MSCVVLHKTAAAEDQFSVHDITITHNITEKDMHLKSVLIGLGISCCVAAPAAAQQSGSFDTLSYNVAGLLELFSSAESDRQAATEQISCYVNDFDIVNVQEDFNYHAALYDTCNTHAYRSATTGGMGIGSGLNSMSHLPFSSLKRVKWNHCNGVDCLTPKGFTLMQVRLAEGVYVDIYNLHTQAQVETADLTARRNNILQLKQYISTQSVGNAVIVMGDTNTRYTRTGDNIRELLGLGFTDTWVELYRSGDIPALGADALVCDPKISAANCEIVDKVLYRDNGYLNLQLLDYQVRQDDETPEGLKLSDHPPVSANWSYSTPANRKMSDQFGGDGGVSFNTVSQLPATPKVSQISVRSGSRVDQVGLQLTNGQSFSHGGNGGTLNSLTLNSGEYLKSVTLCQGNRNGAMRIFYTSLQTSAGRSVTGGSQTSNCTSHQAPAGWQISGFHGRAETELDKLGVIYSPVAL
jgi:hypothetical protein